MIYSCVFLALAGIVSKKRKRYSMAAYRSERENFRPSSQVLTVKATYDCMHASGNPDKTLKPGANFSLSAAISAYGITCAIQAINPASRLASTQVHHGEP